MAALLRFADAVSCAGWPTGARYYVVTGVRLPTLLPLPLK